MFKTLFTTTLLTVSILSILAFFQISTALASPQRITDSKQIVWAYNINAEQRFTVSVEAAKVDAAPALNNMVLLDPVQENDVQAGENSLLTFVACSTMVLGESTMSLGISQTQKFTVNGCWPKAW